MGIVFSLVSITAYAYTDESGNTNDRNTVRIKKCIKVSSLEEKSFVICKKIGR